MIVIVAGMPRSASTASFNIARELLLQTGSTSWSVGYSLDGALAAAGGAVHVLLKTHGPDQATTDRITLEGIPCICTIRKPEEAVASLVCSFGFGLPAAIAGIKGWLEWYAQVADRVLTLDYQHVDTNLMSAIQTIQRYVSGAIDAPSAQVIHDRYAKARIQAQFENLVEGDNTVNVGVSYHDKETFYHRRHVSSRPPILSLTPSDIVRIRYQLRDFVGDHGEINIVQPRQYWNTEKALRETSSWAVLQPADGSRAVSEN